MKYVVITHVVHKTTGTDQYFGYGPYVREMNLWVKNVKETTIVAPLKTAQPDKIDLSYNGSINFIKIPSLNLTNKKEIFRSVFNLPIVFVRVFGAISKADHVHLRCPGNIGLVGCIAQMFFPSKRKTAKYAGNWDKKSKQPWSYNLQKWILNNTFLTRNMQVMVYGNWPDSSKNVSPFFTASYPESLKLDLPPRTFGSQINLIFVGALDSGKRPMLSVKVTEKLVKLGYDVMLHIFGNGKMKDELVGYVNANNLGDAVILHGNQPAETVIKQFQLSHFLIFLSRSEGWPKVVAEAMWWGALPITTAVSCVPEMVGYESRGSIVEPNLDSVVEKIKYYMENPDVYNKKVNEAMQWSRQFTIEKFEQAITQLLAG